MRERLKTAATSKNEKFADKILGRNDSRPLLVIGPTANWSANLADRKIYRINWSIDLGKYVLK